MQGLAPLGQCDQVALVNLGESVVKAPEVARRELLVQRLFPLVENVRDHGLANRARTIAAQDKRASLVIRQRGRLILSNARLLLVPHIGQRANSTRNDLRQVAQNVSGVTASENDFVVEHEVRADVRRIASAKASGEALVVRVAKAHNRARRSGAAHVNLEKTEVTLTETRGRVDFLLDRKAHIFHLVAKDRDEISVRNRLIGFGRVGSNDLGKVGKGDFGVVCTADTQVDSIHIFVLFRLI